MKSYKKAIDIYFLVELSMVGVLSLYSREAAMIRTTYILKVLMFLGNVYIIDGIFFHGWK